MRLKISFKLKGGRQVMPLNYQYPLSSWIYNVLAHGDDVVAKFMHDEGYHLKNGKTFKMFTFSQLYFPRGTYNIIPKSDRMELWSRNAWLTVAFQMPVQAEKFILGLFRDQRVTIGDRISQVTMEVGSVEAEKEPEITSETVKIRCLSPVVVTENKPGNKHETYLSPADNHYAGLLFHNLLDKHKIISDEFAGLDPFVENNGLKFECLTTKPRRKMQIIKAYTPEEVKVRGFMFDFTLTAPQALIRTGFNSGFGAMNAMGFGCGEIIM